MPPHSRKRETDRRSGIDRRQFSYAVHIPERRKNGERRHSGRKPFKRCEDAFEQDLLMPAGSVLQID